MKSFASAPDERIAEQHLSAVNYDVLSKAIYPMMIETPRLLLRPWRESDLHLFAEQNADPAVMQFLGGVLTRGESDAYVARAEAHLAANGFCKWAVEAPGVSPLIGAVGLTRVKFNASFTPAVEVAWRLNRRYWGCGYATEAARAAIVDGFTRMGLTEIVSMTALGNLPSRRVMERLGMIPSIEFDHPLYAEGSDLRRHILYRLPQRSGPPLPEVIRDRASSFAEEGGEWARDSRWR